MRTKHFLVLSLFFLLFISCTTVVNAQLIRYGLKAGVDVSEHKINSDLLSVKNRVGYQIGGVLQINESLTGLGVETGLQYGNKSYTMNVDESVAEISDLNYITVPVMLRKSFSISGLTGIYVKAGVFGNMKISGGDLKFPEGDESRKIEQNGFQAGLDTGVGVSLLNHLEIGMQYRYKFSDTYNKKDIEKGSNLYNIGRQTWTVNLAYLF